MALGLVGRLQALQNSLRIQNPLVDVACQFEVYERGSDGRPHPTGRKSSIYGGRFDVLAGRYVGDAERVRVYPCSSVQFDGVVSDCPILEESGGRGGGKSEGGVLRAIRFMCERPGERGRCLSPTQDLTEVVRIKMLEQLPTAWVTAVRLAPRRLIKLVNGVEVQFRSTHNPDQLRSWGGSWTLVDEAQDVNTYALDVALPCLRESAEPRMWCTLTPKAGEPLERHLDWMESPDADCIAFSSLHNPFISQEVFNIARRGMAANTYQVEIGADWELVASLAADDRKPVFANFKEKRNEFTSLNWKKAALAGEDITAKVVRRKTRFGGRKYIIGIDPNWDWPNYAVIWKVFKPVRRGDPERWCAVNVVRTKGHAGHLGHALCKAGYSPHNSLLVPDASARYNRGNRSSARLLRDTKEGGGFNAIILRSKNPPVTESIDAMLAKMYPAAGEPSLFIDAEHCGELLDCMEAVEWGASGVKLKKSGDEHIIDAARYPVDYFEPAARIRRVNSGFVAA